jgi:hypothetical protein
VTNFFSGGKRGWLADRDQEKIANLQARSLEKREQSKMATRRR